MANAIDLRNEVVAQVTRPDEIIHETENIGMDAKVKVCGGDRIQDLRVLKVGQSETIKKNRPVKDRNVMTALLWLALASEKHPRALVRLHVDGPPFVNERDEVRKRND